MYRFLFCLLFSGFLSGQGLDFAFYNVENLFHPDDDSLTLDEEFTPEGDKKWTPVLYHQKYNKTAKVLFDLFQEQPLAVIGLCEIENAQVMEDLRSKSILAQFPYQWVHYESPDRRGIDVGLMYNKELLVLVHSQAFALKIDTLPDFKTRDLLYAVLRDRAGLDWHVFMAHWPSRYGGKEQSAFKRAAAAALLRAKTDSLVDLGVERMVIMGDFNDEWFDPSLKEVLAAGEIGDESFLVNLMSELPAQSGSHRYRGHWAYLDQVIISRPLLEEVNDFGVHRADFLLERDDRNPGFKPYRSFRGDFYQGGFSDHLPIFVRFKANP